MSTEESNLAFVPRPIEAVGLRGEGPAVRMAMAIIQRTTALRAYQAFSNGRDWMEKLSSAYIVALATRSADTFLMRHIQDCINADSVISCTRCVEATLGVNVIRSKLFPDMEILRKHANKLIHHLDNPRNKGVADLNVRGVFDYCYHLFQENNALLFGEIPAGSFEYKRCKECIAREADSK